MRVNSDRASPSNINTHENDKLPVQSECDCIPFRTISQSHYSHHQRILVKIVPCSYCWEQVASILCESDLGYIHPSCMDREEPRIGGNQTIYWIWIAPLIIHCFCPMIILKVNQ